MPGLKQRRDDGDRHADHAEQVALAAGLGVGQAAQRQDEEDRGRRGRRASRAWSPSAQPPFFLNMASMRLVTMKPPKMFTAASVTARKPKNRAAPLSASAGRQDGADHDHRGDRVGHAHQRRMQRRRHVPHHVVADEAGHQEDGQQVAGRARRPAADGRAPASAMRRAPARRASARAVGDGRRPRWRSAGRVSCGVLLRRPAAASWMDHGAAAGQRDALHDVVVLRQLRRLRLLVPEGGQEGQQVARIERGGGRRRCGRASW